MTVVLLFHRVGNVMKKLVFSFVIGTVSLGTVNGALIAYDGFDYTAGDSLAGKNGGDNWADAWTASGSGSTIQTPGLTYTDSNSAALPTTGNSGQFAGSNERKFPPTHHFTRYGRNISLHQLYREDG